MLSAIEGGLQASERFRTRVPAGRLVLVDDGGHAFGGNLDRHDLAVEETRVPRGQRALMGAQCPGVLLLAADLFFGGDVAAMNTHVTAGDRALQAIADHHVFEDAVAHAVPGAGLAQNVRGVGHALHAAGKHDVVIAGTNQRFGQGDRAHP